MSSDEEERATPVLPKDSDRGSSVSSELQDEYEELIRYAVVTPKLDTLQQLRTSQLSVEVPSKQPKNETQPHHPAAETENVRPLSGRSSRASSTLQGSLNKHAASSRPAHVGETVGQSTSMGSLVSEVGSERLQTPPERSRSTSPDAFEAVVAEMFISKENMSRMENILDVWSNNLKSNVLTELRKWKLVFMEKHKLEMKKEKEKCRAQTAGLQSEIDHLKELLQTYEISNQRKDEVIGNLSQVLERQKEKVEKMRAFTHWRLQHIEVKEEAHAAQAAKRHYELQLKRKVWLSWHSLIQKHWKVNVERACRAKAEEVCERLSAEYEAKLTEQRGVLDKALAEIQRLRLERERYEESMKKAFMRGVCALNMEALNMFQTTEGWSEPLPSQDQQEPPRPDEPGSSSMGPHTGPSTRFNPVHFDHTEPPLNSESEDLMSLRPASRADVLPSSTIGHSSLETTAPFKQQASGWVVNDGQQKSSKTVTARITARSDVSKAARSSLQVMGVSPPMSSVIVERHHPVTQLTVGQATAAKFPRSSQQSRRPTTGRSSSRTHSGTCHIHSIKVVD
ncbi:centrosomal protein POC5 [Boleophthalmus pectinirostris]|uniref:centrosomal protein POC5 n=1 Tax=Boleophthalmus pectinirostris TaxID=150288 RepID=UPI00243119E8|nr:centrosomal protein POC5 [Boleophthalmus pectinirostris]